MGPDSHRQTSFKEEDRFSLREIIYELLQDHTEPESKSEIVLPESRSGPIQGPEADQSCSTAAPGIALEDEMEIDCEQYQSDRVKSINYTIIHNDI